MVKPCDAGTIHHPLQHLSAPSSLILQAGSQTPGHHDFSLQASPSKQTCLPPLCTSCSVTGLPESYFIVYNEGAAFDLITFHISSFRRKNIVPGYSALLVLKWNKQSKRKTNIHKRISAAFWSLFIIFFWNRRWQIKFQGSKYTLINICWMWFCISNFLLNASKLEKKVKKLWIGRKGFLVYFLIRQFICRYLPLCLVLLWGLITEPHLSLLLFSTS